MVVVRAPLALVAMCVVACSPSASVDASADASDATNDRVIEVDAGPPWTLELTVQDESMAPLANAWVHAEHADGRSVEAATDANGIVRLELNGAPWDVTAAMPGRSAFSYMGVDASGLPAIALVHRPTVIAESAGVEGSIRGVVDPHHFTFVSYAQGMANMPTGTTWRGTYDYGDDSFPPTGPLVFSALELDQAQNLVNGAISTSHPRDGTSYTGANAIEITMPNPPRVPRHATIPVDFPTSGILGSDAEYSNVSANTIRWSGNYGYLVGLAYAATPVNGRTDLVFDYFDDAEMLPDAFVASLTVVRDGAWSVFFRYATLTGLTRITLPVIETLQVDASRLDDRASFSAVTDGRGTVVFVLLDSFAPVWSGRFVHSERPISSQLPHLPHGMTVADLSGEASGSLVIQYADLPGDRITGTPADDANVHLSIRNSATVSMEGR